MQQFRHCWISHELWKNRPDNSTCQCWKQRWQSHEWHSCEWKCESSCNHKQMSWMLQGHSKAFLRNWGALQAYPSSTHTEWTLWNSSRPNNLATKKGPEGLELSPWLKEPETGKINSSPSLRALHYQVFIFGIFISCFTNKKWWPINSRLYYHFSGFHFHACLISP